MLIYTLNLEIYTHRWNNVIFLYITWQFCVLGIVARFQSDILNRLSASSATTQRGEKNHIGKLGIDDKSENTYCTHEMKIAPVL